MAYINSDSPSYAEAQSDLKHSNFHQRDSWWDLPLDNVTLVLVDEIKLPICNPVNLSGCTEELENK